MPFSFRSGSRFIGVCCAVLPLLMPSARAATLSHDVNGDGGMSVADVAMTLRFAVGMEAPTAAQRLAADVAPLPGTGGRALGDGVVNINDAIRLLRYLTGQIATLDSRLLSDSALVTDPVGYPANDYTRAHHVPIQTRLAEGGPAVDFTLLDPQGQPHRLLDLLKTKPVLMVFGSFTCHPYRDTGGRFFEMAHQAYDGGRSYADVVHFVHVNIPEAHPAAPDPSPYLGAVSLADISVKRQPRVYEERRAIAAEIQSWYDATQLILVDELEPYGPNNPVWSTYGPAPNAAFLIAQNGTIVREQDWAIPGDMKSAVDALLSRR